MLALATVSSNCEHKIQFSFYARKFKLLAFRRGEQTFRFCRLLYQRPFFFGKILSESVTLMFPMLVQIVLLYPVSQKFHFNIIFPLPDLPHSVFLLCLQSKVHYTIFMSPVITVCRPSVFFLDMINIYRLLKCIIYKLANYLTFQYRLLLLPFQALIF